MNELLDDYFARQKEIFDYFGYVEDWRVLPLSDMDGFYWTLNGEGPGTVMYAETEALLDNENGDYYLGEIYTQRHLPKWVYRGKDYTLVVVDTRVDMNQLLMVFNNSLEVP